MEGIKDENGTVSETTNSTQPKESFAEIGVYFQSLNKKLVYEEPKYTVGLRLEPRSQCRISHDKPLVNNYFHVSFLIYLHYS